MSEELDDLKIIDTKTIHTVEMEIDDDLIPLLMEYGRSHIVNDEEAIMSYAINRILGEYVTRYDTEALEKEIIEELGEEDGDV